MVDVFLSHKLLSTAAQFLESRKKLTDFTIAKLIKAHGNLGNIRAAIQWFHRAKMLKNGDYIHSCNSLLGVLVKANRLALACAIFDQVVKEGVVMPDVSTYTAMIRGYCKMGSIEDALKLFDEMHCKPNLVTYNTIVNGLAKKGMMLKARLIVDRMLVGKDCLPDNVTYTSLIDGYCKNGDMGEAMRCLDEMLKQGCEPNVVTYNAIVNGFCSNGKVDEAKRMMTKMRLNGVKDDLLTHTSLIKGFCVAGRLDEALRHLRDMISLGIEPDVKTYGIVVNECCKLGKPKEAIALLRDMKARGISPSISSFNTVLKVLTQRVELDDAVLLLKRMSELGCSPNFLSYFTVICSLSETEEWHKEVEELVHSMLQNGHKLDASLYSCLAKMYSKRGDLGMAIQAAQDALSTGHVISLDTFAVIMEGLCAKGKIFEAEQHFEEMCKRCQVTHLEDYRSVLNELICKYSGGICQEM